MRRLILGLLLGTTLSGLRAQAGQSLFEFPAPSALSSYGLRALALLSCAVALYHARRLFHPRTQNSLLLAGIALGYALAGFFLLPFQSSASVLWIGALAVAAPLVAAVVRRGLDGRPHESHTLGLGPLAGLAVCAAGVTLAVEGTARGMRLLGAAGSLDDTIFGSVFLVLAAFGAVAFARTLGQLGKADAAKDWGRGRAIEIALAIAAALTLLSQRGLFGLATHIGLRDFMRRYGQDSFDNGMFGYDGIMATAVWIAPAFAVGTAVGCARRASELTALAVGSALACLAIPLRLATDGADPSTAATSATLVHEGVLVAAVGALVTAATRRKAGEGPPRAIGLLIAVACAVAAFALPPPNIIVATPWKRLPTVPTFTLETGAGQIAISPGGMDVDAVSLAGTFVTPDVREAQADRNRIVTSMTLLDEISRARGVDVLLIGQLTPGRALTLTDMGARRIDRTAGWHEVMPALEERLFDERGRQRPAGDVLSPSEARARLDSYALVLALATKGDAPIVPRDLPEASGSPGEPIVVLWIDAGHGVHRRALPAPLLLDADGVEELGVALVRGIDPAEAFANGGRALFEPGAPVDRLTAWRERTVRGPRRQQVGRFLFTRALAGGNDGTPQGELAHGLSLHYGVQQRSSMFETPEQQIELSTEGLDALAAALTETPPDAFTREVWGGLARVLVGHRNVNAIYDYLEPLVERWGPWPELSLALAHADLESLEPTDALERVEGIGEGWGPVAGQALELEARARGELDDHQGAAAALRRLGAVAPSSWQRRQLAIQATLAGEPDGPELLQQLLAEEPEDEELRALLEEGIAPEGPGAPVSGHLNHDH